MPSPFIEACALAVGVIACVTDVRSRRIPNALTFGAALVGVVAHGMADGWDGIWFSLGGWGAGAALFLPFFLLRGMGGGDVKLLAALGAWLGPRDVFWLAIYASLAGGVLAIVVSMSRGYLRTAFRNLWNLVTYWCLVGPRPMPSLTLEKSEAPRLAYALPMLAGTVVVIWLG